MGALKTQRNYTVDEYLARERAAENRHEYLDGEIFTMAGESWSHAVISTNIVSLIHQQNKSDRCNALTKDMKVRSGPSPRGANKARGLYSYPDVVVVCGEPEFHDAETDIVLNPKVIIEVLSPSTEAFNRGEKFTRYQTWNPSLTDYLLVAQDKVQIEHYVRQTNGEWSYKRYTNLKTTVHIKSIKCRLKVTDVYRRVKLPNK